MYSKPQVTIDLEEYNSLLSYKTQYISDNFPDDDDINNIIRESNIYFNGRNMGNISPHSSLNIHLAESLKNLNISVKDNQLIIRKK